MAAFFCGWVDAWLSFTYTPFVWVGSSVVEHLAFNQLVDSSILSRPTKNLASVRRF